MIYQRSHWLKSVAFSFKLSSFGELYTNDIVLLPRASAVRPLCRPDHLYRRHHSGTSATTTTIIRTIIPGHNRR